ncbi:hypothetical protein [Streptomyces sp. NPDC093707]|uniref:hypothetical protein n=1 Tax=Streptomyces sp. NPDC093707 TaxID=3154984 RepID=UPI00344BED38
MLGKFRVAAAGVIATGALMANTASPATAAEPTAPQGGSGSSVAKAGKIGPAGSFTAKVAKVDPKTGAQLKTNTVLCEWGADWKWDAEVVATVTGTTRFFCAAVGPGGPDITGESRARLMYDNNKSAADGERTVIQPLDPTPTISEVTAKVERPESLHVQHDMFADLLSPGWVWLSHPEGCSGAATPAVKCNIDYPSFKI